MQAFAHASPKTVAGAVKLLDNEWGNTEVIAGGTDLITKTPSASAEGVVERKCRRASVAHAGRGLLRGGLRVIGRLEVVGGGLLRVVEVNAGLDRLLVLVDGARAVQMVESIYQSNKAGAEVKIEEI